MYKSHRPSVDELTACTGRLIASKKPPHQFYHGWYPIRDCSFPGHEAKSSAGVPSSKPITSFRNYKVVCEICDHPDNHLLELEQRKNALWCCPRNSVAPVASNVEKARGISENCAPDAYWRYHDKHILKPNGTLPAQCRVHSTNWFKEEMDLINNLNYLKKNRTQLQRLRTMRHEPGMSDVTGMGQQIEQDNIIAQCSLPFLANTPQNSVNAESRGRTSPNTGPQDALKLLESVKQ